MTQIFNKCQQRYQLVEHSNEDHVTQKCETKFQYSTSLEESTDLEGFLSVGGGPKLSLREGMVGKQAGWILRGGWVISADHWTTHLTGSDALRVDLRARRPPPALLRIESSVPVTLPLLLDGGFDL